MTQSISNRGARWLLIAATSLALLQPGYAARQEAQLSASDATMFDSAGNSVAVSGSTVIMGAFFADAAATDAGSAYVFVRGEHGWSQQAKLEASDAEAEDQFGWSTAIDGDTAVVGAFLDDDSGVDSGSVYVFVRSNGQWSQQAKITAADGASGDRFGASVAIDGDTIVVGASQDDGAGIDAGSAYVFTRKGSHWTQQAKLVAADGAATNRFGVSVALDGNTALVGAYFDDDAGKLSGSAYVFTRNDESWTQQAKLTASDAATGDLFGAAVAIYGDTAVIGASRNDDAGSSSGSSYVFSRNASGWNEVVKLSASDAAMNDKFGHSVAIHGAEIVVGAVGDDEVGKNSGSAYVFTRDGGSWKQRTKLNAAGGTGGDQFGFSVAKERDFVVIGAVGVDESAVDSGSAYVFNAGNASTDEPQTAAVEQQP